ncbi:hypothetical protein IW262DRAFT_1300971 [Armillaria fumosa]|nr:hypothetical protein IW262DRAFT_1300971 [Armillaria fumosa]
MFAEGPAVPALPELLPLSFISVSLHFSTVANLEISFSFSVHQNPSSPKWLMRRDETCRMTYTQATGMCLSFAVWLKMTYRLPMGCIHRAAGNFSLRLRVDIRVVGYNPQVRDPPMIVQRWSPFSPQDLKNILKTTTFTSPQRINIRRAGIGSACFIPQHFKTFNTHSWTTTFTWPQRINIRQAGITSISKDGTTIEDIQIYAATTYRRLGEQGDWNTLGSVEHEDAQMSGPKDNMPFEEDSGLGDRVGCLTHSATLDLSKQTVEIFKMESRCVSVRRDSPCFFFWANRTHNGKPRFPVGTI